MAVQPGNPTETWLGLSAHSAINRRIGRVCDLLA